MCRWFFPAECPRIINDPEKSITRAFSSVIGASSWVSFFFFSFLLQRMLLLERACVGTNKKKQKKLFRRRGAEEASLCRFLISGWLFCVRQAVSSAASEGSGF